jgi:hypothetical protein
MDSNQTAADLLAKSEEEGTYYRLIHPEHDDKESLRLAEDLRFFHAHLQAKGILRLIRTESPLVTYRHSGTSQSFRTSRRLLLQLRVLAFEQSILRASNNPRWQQDDGQFVVWGAGRDGKEFVKSLSLDNRKRIYCFVDVDVKKLDSGSYVNRQLGLGIPIIHFSFLAKDREIREKIQRDWEEGSTNDALVGRIDKTKEGPDANAPELQETAAQPKNKKRKTEKPQKLELRGLCPSRLQRLPVVVCVAMYRTNGMLERNVQWIQREEGVDLWHFS